MENDRLSLYIEKMKQTLLEELKLESVDPTNPIVVREVPDKWKLLGAGNYAGVFYHEDDDDIAVKVYAPGREGWEEEYEVYRRIGDHPAYSACYDAGVHNGHQYLVLRRLRGKTLYNCVLEGVTIPKSVIDDIDEALDYARAQGLYPHDVHGKNVMVSNGKGIVVDISDFLKQEPCTMWDDLKKAYYRIYMPLLSKHTFAVPEWVMNGVRKGYRWIKHFPLNGRSS